MALGPPPHRSITPEPPADGHPDGLEPEKRAARGTTVGRYFVLRTLGEGGMGIVYSAFDPELDRKIALKLLRRDRLPGRDWARRARLVREAQAMAKVSHPNVVAVHDVGTHGDSVFVAMELVEGGTVTEWLAQTRRPVEEIVSVFLEAGKGLAAAHEAGLVHRDFKPENVLVGHDGRVRVTDFGLARLGPVADTKPQPVAGTVVARPDDWKAPLTRDGAVVGTPLYMSPEQSRGQVPDARSDQYNFCASLYWAIFGDVPEGPFERDLEAGNSKESTQDSIRDPGAAKMGLVTFPREPRLPSRLRRALLRGLSWDPRERHPSMDALLRELRQEEAHSLRRKAVVGGAAAAALLLVAGVSSQVTGRSTELCGGSGEAVAAVWDPARRGEVRGALVASGLPGGEVTANRVTEILDRYAEGWAGARHQACVATRVRGEQTEAVLSARMICLDRALHQMEALVHVLRSVDRAAAQRSVDAALDLPSLSMCEAGALGSRPPLPEDPAARFEIESVQVALDEIRSLYGVGRFQVALKKAEAARARAEALAYWPLRSEALFWHGLLQERTGASNLAEQSLRQAVVAADRAAAGPEKIRALAKLVFVNGHSLGRFEEAAFFAQLAESELGRYPLDELHLELDMQRGLWLTNQGKLEEGMAAYQRALSRADRAVGPDHPKKGALLSNLAALSAQLNRHGEAIALLQEALRIISASRGPEHPTAAYIHYNLGRSLLAKSELTAAHQSIQEALRIREVSLGAEHPAVAEALDVLATVLHADGLYMEALAQSQRALAIKRKALGPDHLDLCYSLENAGFAQLALGAAAKAVEPLEKSIALREKAGGQRRGDGGGPLCPRPGAVGPGQGPGAGPLPGGLRPGRPRWPSGTPWRQGRSPPGWPRTDRARGLSASRTPRRAEPPAAAAAPAPAPRRRGARPRALRAWRRTPGRRRSLEARRPEP